MINLKNLEEIKKLDPKDVYGSTELFAKQCEQIWKEGEKLLFPSEYQEIENIVICGMGGSAYGGHIVFSLYKDELKIPLYINTDYHLPAFVSEKTLVLLTSYSGSTEEVLSCAKEAFEKSAKVIGLTSGGELGKLLKTQYVPSLIFDPFNNPSGQPRLGYGYIVLGTIAILSRMELITINEDEVHQMISELKKNTDTIKEKAIESAQKIVNTIPVLFASEFLYGNSHIIRNQFNETSKSFSAFSPIPELNHHLMEGLQNPPDKKLSILFITSNLYSHSIKKRIELTQDVVSKNNIPFLEYEVQGSSKLSQVFNALSFGGYLTLYLAFLYGLDPSLIPWVDYFKEQLKKSS